MKTFFVCFLFFPTWLPCSPLSIELKSEYALLMNAETGKILLNKKGFERVYPASTTKIASALFALECAGDELDVPITATQDCIGTVSSEEKKRSNYTLPAYWLEPDASHMGIKRGEILSLKDLLYGHMLVSADDASNLIAYHVGGSIPKFMDMLNEYLRKKGCQQTKFMNPHGLFHPEHTTTAYDLALLMQEGLKNEMFRKLISTTSYLRPKTNKQEAVPLIQTNRLIRPGKYYYPKTIGGKTGYISAAQNNIVAAATDPSSGRTLIAVLMKCKERKDLFQDAVNLFEAAFRQPKVRRVLLKAGPQKYTIPIEKSRRKVQTQILEQVTIDYFPAEEPEIHCLLYPGKIKLPIQENQVVGTLDLVNEKGEILKTVPLLALKKAKRSLLQKLPRKLSYPTVVFAVLVLLLIGLYKRVKKKKILQGEIFRS